MLTEMQKIKIDTNQNQIQNVPYSNSYITIKKIWFLQIINIFFNSSINIIFNFT